MSAPTPDPTTDAATSEPRGRTPGGGVSFPCSGLDGVRSTSAFGRSVLAAAMDGVDPVGTRAAASEANWRSGYPVHFRRALEAGLSDPQHGFRTAADGLAAFTAGMRWIDPANGDERGLAELGPRTGEHLLHRVTGSGERAAELALPYRGRMLTGADLAERLSAWVDDGVLEPGAAQAVQMVADNPDWLSLPGHTVVALGVGAEIGPAPTLLRWGARVIGLDLPFAGIWRRVLDQAAGSAGTLVLPVRPGDGPAAERAGFDLLTELPQVAAWIDDALESSSDGEDRTAVLGNYLYADGAANVRVSAAGDALATMLQRRHPELVQAYLATPTDVFAVPEGAVARSVETFAARSRSAAVRLTRAASGGRLLRRAYLPGTAPGICDSLVTQQGPNYALAKRMQRWRACAERAAGRRISLNVAPPTRTRSVVKNRALAAAYAGAHRFGVEVFDPSTTRVLMAALLVHDLVADVPTFAHPWQAEAHQAVHGGLWTSPFEPRSTLGLAAVLGFGASRQ